MGVNVLYCTQKLYKYETCACYVIATSPYHIFEVIYYPIINFIQPLSLLQLYCTGVVRIYGVNACHHSAVYMTPSKIFNNSTASSTWSLDALILPCLRVWFTYPTVGAV